MKNVLHIYHTIARHRNNFHCSLPESTDATPFCRSIHGIIPFSVFYLSIIVEGDGSGF